MSDDDDDDDDAPPPPPVADDDLPPTKTHVLPRTVTTSAASGRALAIPIFDWTILSKFDRICSVPPPYEGADPPPPPPPEEEGDGSEAEADALMKSP